MAEKFDPEQIAARQRAAAQKRIERERDDLVAVMSSAEGRRLVWRLLERAGVFRISYSADSDLTIFNEGQRNQGLRLFTDAQEFCPKLYLTMAQEAAADAARERAQEEAEKAEKANRSED